MQMIESHIAVTTEKPIRFQEYAVGIFNSIPSKSGIKKAIKKELIFINDTPATTATYIHGGERIELYSIKTEEAFKRLVLPLEVLYEDHYLAVIYKPSGILVSGNKFVTIANGLPQNLQKSTKADAVKPQPVHRLDYPTSGVLLVGKTSAAIVALSDLFKDKKIKKTYYAVCIGQMQVTGHINEAIDGKNAETHYEVLETVSSKRFGFLNFVKLSPSTGRKHQLRIHLASIRNQILGDQEHGEPRHFLKGKGLYLHAASLDFIHPLTKEPLCIHKEIPKKFKKIFPLQSL